MDIIFAIMLQIWLQKNCAPVPHNIMGYQNGNVYYAVGRNSQVLVCLIRIQIKERPRKYSPVRRESRGTRSVVRGKGEGGEERRETGTKRIKREIERRITTGTQHLPTRRRTQDHRGHRKNQEGNRASGVGMHLAASGWCLPTRRRTQDHSGWRRLLRPPPPTPKPSTTRRTGWGGGANLHMGRWVGKLEEDICRPEPEGW